jgi:hypothetical protein
LGRFWCDRLKVAPYVHEPNIISKSALSRRSAGDLLKQFHIVTYDLSGHVGLRQLSEYLAQRLDES